MVVVHLLSCVHLFDPMDCNLPGSSVLGILQEEYRSGLPFPSPGDLLDPGIEPGSPALQANSLPTELEEEKLKFCLLLPLQLILPLAKARSRRSHNVRKWGLEILGNGVYLTHPCPALWSSPAPANLLNHACRGQASPPPPAILTTLLVCAKSSLLKPACYLRQDV